jgi:hypothetical protein
MNFDVFISYPHQDKPTADAACATMEAKGIRCWIAPRDIIPGREWSESIIEAIENSKVMVLVFSGHANTSRQITREVERAVNKGVPIIPVRIENVLPSKALEYFISTPHWLDALTPPLERHLEELAASVRALFDAKSAGSASYLSRPLPKLKRAFNGLEWLSTRGMPDSIRALTIVVSAILTLAPYLGGMTIWSFGATPMSVPTLPAGAIWPLVLMAPFWWCFLLVRIVGASARQVASYLSGALLLSAALLLLHLSYPGIALAAITPNYDQTFRFGFLELQHSWIASHERDALGERYCHFRTPPVSLGAAVRRSCTLRVDKIDFHASGSAAIPDRSGFDVEIYLGTNSMLSETTECVPTANWPAVKDHPVGSEVALHGAIEVIRSGLKPGGAVDFSLGYDYRSQTGTAQPAFLGGRLPEVSQVDIAVSKSAQFQISGWTLWGDPSHFQMDVIELRVQGRLICGPAAMLAWD